MKIDIDLLTRFEKNLLPHALSRSPIPVTVIGFGEISAIFQIGDNQEMVYKRIPIFPDLPTAHAYRQMYFDYCRQLKQAGIHLPEDDVAIIDIPGRPVVVYFAQQRFDDHLFCHHLINSLDETGRAEMINQIMTELTRIWNFNTHKMPDIEIAVDGQLSLISACEDDTVSAAPCQGFKHRPAFCFQVSGYITHGLQAVMFGQARDLSVFYHTEIIRHEIVVLKNVTEHDLIIQQYSVFAVDLPGSEPVPVGEVVIIGIFIPFIDHISLAEEAVGKQFQPPQEGHMFSEPKLFLQKDSKHAQGINHNVSP